MLNLIKNEYIKVFKKKSTILWIVLVLLFTVGFQTLIKFTTSQEDSFYNSYYYEQGTTYMSEEYVDQNIKDLKEYATSSNTYDADVLYFENIKEYKLYDLDDWVYDELRSVYYTYLEPLNNPATKDSYTKEESEKMNTIYSTLLSSLGSKDYKGFYETLAANESKASYTFDGSDKAITAPYEYKLSHGYTPYEDEVKSNLVDTIVGYQDTLESYATSSISSASSKQQTTMDGYLIALYQLDHNLSYVITDSSSTLDLDYTADSSKFWFSFQTSTNLIIALCILIIVIAGGCIASEFSSGTIKFLLINPVKRSKIIISKYAMILSLTAIFVTCFYFVNILLGILFYGTSDLTTPYLSVVNNTVVSSSAFLHIAKLYLYNAVEVICYGTMAFAISSLFRNSSIGIGASVACLVSGNVVTILLQQLRQDWGRYLLFANTDILSIKNGTSIFPHHTMGFAVAILAIHMVVMLLIAYDGFCRKEV